MSELRARFDRDGYAALPGLLDAGEVAAINEAARALSARPELGGVAIEDALAIHFPHKLSPLIRETMTHPAIVAVLTQLIGPDVKCMQSMYFVKAAGKPGQAWHQDEAFIPTRDRSLTAAWIALDDATVENGCLWVLPGSQRSGVIWPTRAHGDPDFDATRAAYDFPYREEDAVPVEVAAGSVVFFNGYLLHRSLRNRATAGLRRALVFHCMSAQSWLPWSCGGRIPATEDNRDVVMVAGSDPYAGKGIEDHSPVFVRREMALARG